MSLKGRGKVEGLLLYQTSWPGSARTQDAAGTGRGNIDHHSVS